MEYTAGFPAFSQEPAKKGGRLPAANNAEACRKYVYTSRVSLICRESKYEKVTFSRTNPPEI